MSITVCIVEDDAALREEVRAFIDESPGLTCIGACATGEEAVEAVPLLQPDVVLMDINLPGMSGIECTRSIKSLAPDSQVVMFTVYENSDQVFEALAAGACGYLVKNTPPEKLLAAIEDIHNGGSPMSSHIARKVVQAFTATPAAAPAAADLSHREREVLELLAQGRAYKQIAAQLGLSIGTIRTYIRRIYEKLQVNCRTEAVVKFLAAPGSSAPPGAGALDRQTVARRR